MKKSLVLSILVIMVLASIPVFGVHVSDIENHWGKAFIEELITNEIVSGYPDGTFKPDSTITRAEFTVMILKTQNIAPTSGMGTHWASNWKESAIASGILMSSEFDDLDKNITRGEIALMVTRSIGESDFMEARMLDIEDASTLDMELKNAIYSVYDYGIVSGYSDKTFRHDQPATRAEAATMAVRTIQSDKRSNNQRVFNKETLALYNGKNGKPTLVAVDGVVYDFSELSKWAGGSHFNGLTAGKDLTNEIKNDSPHGLSVLSRAEIVGTYVE